MKKIHRRLSLFLNPETQDFRFNPNQSFAFDWLIRIIEGIEFKPIKRFQIWERFRKRNIMLEIITKKEIHSMKILKKLQTEFD